MEHLKEIAERRRAAHERLVGLGSRTYAAFLALEAATFRDGALSRKQKELVALGISIARNCESCMQWHVEQAARAGASFDECLEAVEVAIEMGGGPATVSSRFALEVMDGVFGEPAAGGNEARAAAPGGRQVLPGEGAPRRTT